MKSMTNKSSTSVLLLAISLAAILLFIFFLNAMQNNFTVNETQVVKNSVVRAVATCYAIEGFYPEDISYLADNYGLNLNRDAYVYHYSYLGNNMMPEIYVFKLAN